MSGFTRKLARNKLKQQLGTNKIKEYWHTQNDSIEERLKRGLKNAKNEKI